MASSTDQSQTNILSSQENFFAHLHDRLEYFEHTLDDDENFCNKEIDSTYKYIENIEKKFNEKVQAVKAQLEEIRLQNKKASKGNKDQFDKDWTKINDLYTSQKYEEAWEKLEDYEKSFKQRTTLLQKIPKLEINESDIEQLFSSDRKRNNTVVQPTAIATKSQMIMASIKVDDDDNQKSNDNVSINEKKRLRAEKTIKSIDIKKDNEDTEEFNKDKMEEDYDTSTFGIQSRMLAAQQAAITIQNEPTNDTASSMTTNTPRPRFLISSRLRASSNNNNISFSGRGISTPSSTLNKNGYTNDKSTESKPVFSRRQNIENVNGENNGLILNMMSLYQPEPNMRLLVACSSQNIICFKNQFNRLDTWKLGVIERVRQVEYPIDWHDGLIISMGVAPNNQIYIFTELEFSVYSITERRKIVTRILKQGDIETLEPSCSRKGEFQRGIGTMFNKYLYHIYKNRNDRWTLSRFNKEKDYGHMYDYDLTERFPDVWRFIHLCVNENTINFLVQMNDLSYGVVFCSTNDCKVNDKANFIPLLNAKNPLTICSAFVKCLSQDILFVNDPSINILHILSTKAYLESYQIYCYAINCILNQSELVIVTNDSISSISLNRSTPFFSAVCSKYVSDV